jgi:hypothetical protein
VGRAPLNQCFEPLPRKLELWLEELELLDDDFDVLAGE